MTVPSDWDLIVVGAGPAGSAAAIAAKRENPDARVLLLDRAPLGRDKVCGDGIAPHAVAELELLGVSAVRPEEHVGRVRLVAPGGGGAAAVTTSPGFVVPRAIFDARMLQAALDAGVEFTVEKVQTLRQEPGAEKGDKPGKRGDPRAAASVTVNERYTAPVVIGADGSNSIVRRLIGQPANRGRAMAVAIRGYAPTPPGIPLELTIRWDTQRSGGLCYAWAFPVADGTTNIGYGLASSAVDRSRAHLIQRLADLLPEYDLAGVTLTGHTLPLTVSRPRPAVGRVLLVGDAASLINPFTGEGIYSAIASGAMAGRAAIAATMPARGAAVTNEARGASVTNAAAPDAAAARYSRELASRFSRQHRQTTALYRIIDYPAVLNTVVRAAHADSRTFQRLLDVGLGDAAFTLADLARFGRYAAARDRVPAA